MLLAAFIAMLPAAVPAQERGTAAGAAVPATAAAAEVPGPNASLFAQRDELTRAIVKRDAASVAALIRSGMNLNFNFSDGGRGRSAESPLTLAINRDHVDIARVLLDGGAQVGRDDGAERSAIHCVKSAAAVRLLVERGANVNAQDRRGRTAIALAVERGSLHTLDMLVAGGARLDAPLKDTDLFTLAVQSRHSELVEALLERGLDPGSPPTRALWPLIESGDTGRAVLLIRRGADPNARNDRDTLLTRALFRQRWEVAEALIDAGANVRLADAPGCGRTFMNCQSIALARLGSFNPRVLAKMVGKGLDPSAVGADGHSALSSLIVEEPLAVRTAGSRGLAAGVAMNAATGESTVTATQMPATAREIPAPDNLARAKTLLDARADPNLKYRDATLLMLAIGLPKKPPELADAVLQAGGRIDIDADIARPGSEDGPTLPGPGPIGAEVSSRRIVSPQIVLTGMSVGPLTWALGRGRPDIALRLIERERQVGRADRHLLYFAAATEQWDLLLGALPYSKEVNASDRADVTPLMLAADAGNARVVQALLAAGANVNARSVRNWPPLSDTNFPASLGGHSPAPPKLVGGYTALRAAKQQGHAEVAKVLMEAGGRE